MVASSLSIYWTLAWLALGVLTLAFWMGAVGGSQLLWSLPGRAVALVCLVSALAYGAGIASEGLWETSAALTFRAVAQLLALFEGELVVEPEALLLGLDDFLVVIAPACSGLEGVGLMFVFVSAYLWFYRGELRLPAALVMVPAALFFMWWSNAFRIAALVLLGARGHVEQALQGFHTKAGWVLFSGLALAFAGLTQRLFGQVDEREDAAPQTRYIAPLLVVLATAMVSGLFSGMLWYPLRVITGGLALAYLWRDRLPNAWRWDRGHSIAVLAGLLGGLVWWGLAPVASAQPDLAGWSAGSRLGWILFRVLGAALIAPIVEELAFRGYLLKRLEGACGQILALGLSSLAFGALHSASLAGIAAGLLFGLVWLRRRSDADAIIAHATANIALLWQVL